jgi:hypothetical protein
MTGTRNLDRKAVSVGDKLWEHYFGLGAPSERRKRRLILLAERSAAGYRISRRFFHIPLAVA